MRKNMFYLVAGVLGVVAAVFAGEADAADEESGRTISSILLGLLPWIVVFVFIWLFVLRSPRTQQQRLMLHMERVEQKYDRIIQLLEKLVDRQARDEDRNRSQDEPCGGAGGPS